MYELTKNGKVFTSKFVGAGPSSYKKNNLPGRSLTKVKQHCSTRPAIHTAYLAKRHQDPVSPVKGPGSEAYRSPLSNVKVQKVSSNTSNSPYIFTFLLLFTTKSVFM